MAETPMVEKVARALCAADTFDPDATYYDEMKEEYFWYWKLYEADARTAIQAMRMTHLPGDSMDIINAKRAWNAGIDAALAAPDEGQSP